MNSAANFLVTRALQQYLSRLQSWTGSVRAAPDLERAILVATQTPAAGSLGAMIRPLASADLGRAKARNEEEILRRIERSQDALMALDASHLLRMSHQAQGHLPRAWSRLDAIRKNIQKTP